MSAEPREPWYDALVARVPHGAWRAGGSLWFAALVVHRLHERAAYGSAALFWLEAAVPMTILAAYLTRPAPVQAARGAGGVLAPFLAAGLPLAFLEPPFTDVGRAHLALFAGLLIGPTAWMVWGYLALNRSYALMAEARQLVIRGPYRYMRHPVYAAQLACGAVVVAFRFSLVSLLALAVFAWLQSVRIRAEEAALAAAFPDKWAAYAAHVKRFGIV